MSVGDVDIMSLVCAGSHHTTRHAQRPTVSVFQGHGPFDPYLLGFVWALL